MKCGIYNDGTMISNYCTSPYVKSGPDNNPFRGINSLDYYARRRAQMRKLLCEACMMAKESLPEPMYTRDNAREEGIAAINGLALVLFTEIDYDKKETYSQLTDTQYKEKFYNSLLKTGQKAYNAQVIENKRLKAERMARDSGVGAIQTRLSGITGSSAYGGSLRRTRKASKLNKRR